MYNILVTGVGAIIGYGIIQSIKNITTSVRIIGTDIYDDAVGQHWCDVFETVPLASSQEYIPTLIEIIKNNSVDLVIPGIEQDLEKINLHREELSKITTLALNNPDLIKMSHDKWNLHQFLLKNNFPTIKTKIEGEFSEGDYESLMEYFGSPFLIKPRKSYASKGLYIISSSKEFHFYREQLGQSLMIQEVIGTDDEEYTVGVFGTESSSFYPKIAFRRTLSKEGATKKAVVVIDPKLESVVERLCHLLKPIGATNFQFRYSKGDYYLLEVNPRFSSSHSLREVFGFHEVQMTINYFLNTIEPISPVIKLGTAQRYIADHFILENK